MLEISKWLLNIYELLISLVYTAVVIFKGYSLIFSKSTIVFGIFFFIYYFKSIQNIVFIHICIVIISFCKYIIFSNDSIIGRYVNNFTFLSRIFFREFQ